MDAQQRIAIVSMGGEFPGARSLDAFWQNILAARSAASEPPPGRWAIPVDEAYKGELTDDHVQSRLACFVDEPAFDPANLDFATLDIDPALVERLDPVFRLALAGGAAAWRGARTTNIDPRRVGVILGNIVLPTQSASAIAEDLFIPHLASRISGGLSTAHHAAKPLNNEPLNRYPAGLPAGLLAGALGLGLGGYTLDAACASSLYAIKFAADELIAGRADAMLAGGLSRPDSLYTQMGFSQLHAISPSGRCAPFAASANGLVVGEGCGVFVLKRLEDARRDGDRIHAVIVGAGLSNDIGGNLMAPDSEGQLRAMEAAYAQAGWDPSSIDLIECHGTGTPIGDAVEFNSLTRLWSRTDGVRSNRCVIGSVKSNVGHLLTAAGAAGLVKTLFAINDRQLPPTANFDQPAAKINFTTSPFEVLREPRDWPASANGQPRRAAVSAFGFGGINAHVLLEEYREQASHSRVSVSDVPDDANRDTPAIAIIGMDAHFGPWDSMQSLARRFFASRDDATTSASVAPTRPANDWGLEQTSNIRGHVIDKVNIPLGRFRVPPNELRDMLPQQLLMLSVAANALEDAGWDDFAEADETVRLRTGVYIGIGLDLQTTNYHVRWSLATHAKRWANELGIDSAGGAYDTWLNGLREAFGPALSANRVMGSLGGIVASRIARAFRIGGPSFTISSEETSGLRALERARRALERGEIDQAVVGAVDFATEPRAALNRSRQSAQDVLCDGGAAFILKRYDDALRDGDDVLAVLRDAKSGDHSALEMPDAAAEIGDAGAASALATLAKAALSVRHQYLPDNEGNGRYWLRDRIDGPRRALVRGSSVDGHELAIVLEEPPVVSAPISVETLSSGLFTIAAESSDALMVRLDTLQRLVEQSPRESMHELARRGYEQSSGDTGQHRVAIIASDAPQFMARMKTIRSAISKGERLTTEGAYYSFDPLASKGDIAFVFPGSGNHYAGMGAQLATHFPHIAHRQDVENHRLRSQFAGGRFWQDQRVSPDDQHALIFSQVFLGAMVSDIVRAFNIEPRAVIGYSLGETAGLFATRTWTARDEMLERMERSSLFTTDLAGPCRAAREVWDLPDDSPVEWQTGVVHCSADEINRAIASFTGHVYLLIINTPVDCVIGGQKSDVERFVNALGCAFHLIEGVTTVHCEVAKPVAEAYRDLHLFETNPPEDIRFYSAALGKARPVTRESAADSIVAQAIAPFDYTKVIESAYADGTRIFLEIGPGASCTRMISRILGDRPHVARAVCVAGRSEIDSLLQSLSQVFVEGVPVCLDPIFANAEVRSDRWRDAKTISIEVGGKHYDPPAMPVAAASPAPAVVSHTSPSQTERPSIQFKPAMGLSAPTAMTTLTLSYAAQMQEVIEQATACEVAHAGAERAFLQYAQEMDAAIARCAGQTSALRTPLDTDEHHWLPNDNAAEYDAVVPVSETLTSPPVFMDRDQCFEFATGKIGNVLGPAFAPIDNHATRVRLPDAPLQLVDRIVEVEGEPLSMSSGRVVTEHDIHQGAWYLDGGRIPTCIAVEAGQADLFLSGYLGIDFITKGQAVYRLLDAAVTFHAPLPTAGQTIHYDIRIREFFHQGDTWLFRFDFDATVNGELVLTMENGCAGFFTPEALAAGQGIIQTRIDLAAAPGRRPADWRDLAPMPQAGQVEHYTDEQIDALRTGQDNALAHCFGEAFAGLSLRNSVGLPDGRMRLVHRVLSLDAAGGRFGLGIITGEADIHLDDWFLTCHFIDDQVMPGTLMYECCLHTLRIYLLRMGWVAEADEVAYEPVPGVSGQLKCRGQVIATTRKVQYEITLKEIGYQDGDGAPYVMADALMYADGRPIVRMKDMSLRMSGTNRAKIEAIWSNAQSPESNGHHSTVAESAPLFDRHHILAFAVGKPSEAFGDRYKVFDRDRKIARLPGPPFAFLDRITRIENCEPWKLSAGGEIVAEYDVPLDAWYFAANSQREMPFAVLLEAALQPCGWFAAYLGSALTSDIDLRFRNLGGKATLHRAVMPDSGTLCTRVKITSVSTSGGMIIQHFAFNVYDDIGDVYTGTTYFGFFTVEALANQVGIRDATLYTPTPEDCAQSQTFAYPDTQPFPGTKWRMIDRIDHFAPRGGEHGLGFIRGVADVNPDTWFFKAHFFEDPVWPGSLGLESFMQLLKVAAWERWGGSGSGVPGLESGVKSEGGEFGTIALGQPHEWVYRGQIVPKDKLVTVEATISAVDDAKRQLTADGWLSVDGRVIYRMIDFVHTMRD